MKANKKMPRHETVARRMRDIFRPNATRRAKVARRKENSVGKDRTSDKVMLRSPKGGTFRKRLWKGPECNTGIRDRGLKQRLRVSNQLKDLTKNATEGCRLGQRSHLGRRGTLKVIFYEIIGRKFAKQIAGSSVGLRQGKSWTLWRG
jgi:hypothetical protein